MMKKILSLFMLLFLVACSSSDPAQPQDFLGLSSKRNQEAQLAFAKARLLWPSVTRMGNVEYQRCTNPPKALELLTEAIRHEPSFAEAYAFRGLAKSEIDDHKGAIDDLNIAVRFSDNYRFLAFRALVLLRGKQVADAQKDLDASLSRESSQPYAWKIQGLLHEEEGKLEESCRAYKKACSYGDCSSWNRALKQEKCKEDSGFLFF